MHKNILSVSNYDSEYFFVYGDIYGDNAETYKEEFKRFGMEWKQKESGWTLLKIRYWRFKIYCNEHDIGLIKNENANVSDSDSD
jgi:hypothetical protein